jgi:hypothetical protein
MVTPTNCDGIGVSDDFERFFGLNLTDPADRSLDTDGDGLTNRQEFEAGTNPLDLASGFDITAVAKNGNDLLVTFGTALPAKTLSGNAGAGSGALFGTTANVTGSIGNSYNVNFSQTLAWGGISSVTDADTGQPITGWTITSQSGFDYSQALSLCYQLSC